MKGRIIANRIHSNSYAGIEVKETCPVPSYMRNTACSRNSNQTLGGCGHTLQDASAPEVRGNDIYSGRTSGRTISMKADPNRIDIGILGILHTLQTYSKWKQHKSARSCLIV
eukprot:3136912-Amphidinium_carterae.1